MKALQPRLLVVDEDPSMRRLLSIHLSRVGYRTRGVADLPAMQRALADGEVDLLIFGLFSPLGVGGGQPSSLNAAGDLPIILIVPDERPRDCVCGLESGADDCLARSFDPDELVARVGAVLRRYDRSVSRRNDPGRVRFGPFELDLESLELTRGGRPVALTAGEFDLLRIFVTHPNRVLDRDRLLDMLKGYEYAPLDRSIDVQIARLRSKIEENRRSPRFIRTVWGKGYKFTPQGQLA